MQEPSTGLTAEWNAHMSSVIDETWWLDTSGLPDLLWARLRVFADGTAELFDLDGRYTKFASRDEARLFLLEDEYEAVTTMEAADLALHGLPPGGPTPPNASDDSELVAQMLVRVGTSTTAGKTLDAPLHCLGCRTPMVAAAKFAGHGAVERFRFCMRCGLRSEGQILSGQLEAEPDWVVAVRIPSNLSAAQLAALRRSDVSLGNVSQSKLREDLGDLPVLVLGPYWPPAHAAARCDELRAAGLDAEVVSRRA